MKKAVLLIVVLLTGLVSSLLYAKYEQEQIQMETQLQQRIEGILAKTLPANSYLVTVKVEMENRERPSTKQTTTKSGGFKTLLGQNQYVLPGVPQKKEFVTPPETTTEVATSGFAAETLVKRILITVLVAPDVSVDQVRGVREVISASIPFNPLRGDEMDIQNSTLLRPANANTSNSSPGFASGRAPPVMPASYFSTFSDKANAPVLMLVGAVSMAFILFLGFLFGPVRAFLNRLLAVLPRIGEQAAYTVSNAPVKATATGTPAANSFNNSSNGNGHHGQAEEDKRPFRCIHEDQLGKLPILFKSMTPVQCALVLAYIPAEWASKVLSALDNRMQTSIMNELSQAHEVPPEIVKDLEEQVKSKLPYLVGGVEWIQSVYQLTQPHTQRALLGTLNEQSPELAQSLRRKTFFLEDLNVITPGALRMVFQEVGYPIAALALRDERPENRETLLNRLPIAMREILQQEMDLAGDDQSAIADAKTRLLDVGRRLLTDGRITLPEVSNG